MLRANISILAMGAVIGEGNKKGSLVYPPPTPRERKSVMYDKKKFVELSYAEVRGGEG